MKKYLLLILISFSFSSVWSEYSFATAEQSARAGSCVANSLSSCSFYSNPSSLAELDKFYMVAGKTHINDYEFLPYSYLGLAFNMFDKFTFGLTAEDFSTEYSNISLSDELSIGLISSFYLQRDGNSTISFAAKVNYYHSKFGSSAGSSGDGTDGLPSSIGQAVGVDIGFTATLREKNRIGIYYENINVPSMGRGLSNSYLPRKLSIGISYMPYKSLTTSLDVERIFGRSDIQYQGSIRYEIFNYLSLYMGMQQNPNMFGIGFGLHLNIFSLDYGLLTHHSLPLTQQFTLSIHK